jgi:hypothetical protein
MVAQAVLPVMTINTLASSTSTNVHVLIPGQGVLFETDVYADVTEHRLCHHFLRLDRMARLIPKQSKGMGIKTSVKSGNFRATKSGAGITAKGRCRVHRKANPGSKLKTAVTGDNHSLKADAKRQEVFLRPL